MNNIISSVELAKAMLELALTACSFIAGAWFIGKKINGAIKKYTVEVDKMTSSFQEMNQKQQLLEKSFDHMSRSFCELTQKLDYREKDIFKLEGALETTRRDLVNLISSTQQSVSSNEALWRTLQTLFPSQVPRRASDKDTGAG